MCRTIILILAALGTHAVSPPPTSGREFIRGDANSDRLVDVSDAIFLIESLFLGGSRPECEDAADGNDDGDVDIGDPIFILVYFFRRGSPPPAPGPDEAGFDGTPDDEFPCGDLPEELDLSENEIFERLTNTSWRRPHFRSWFAVREEFKFNADGSFSWSRHSDILEGWSEGLWNFVKRTPGGGTIYFSDGNLLHFGLMSDETLLIRHLLILVPGEVPGADCDQCAREELPEIQLSPLVETLISTKWRKANDFDLFYRADLLVFSSTGECFLS